MIILIFYFLPMVISLSWHYVDVKNRRGTLREFFNGEIILLSLIPVLNSFFLLLAISTWLNDKFNLEERLDKFLNRKLW